MPQMLVTMLSFVFKASFKLYTLRKYEAMLSRKKWFIWFKCQLLRFTLDKPPNFSVSWYPHLQTKLGVATTL